MTISERLIRYRAKNNMTQAELAEKIGVGRDLINKLENNRIKASRMILAKLSLLEKGDI